MCAECGCETGVELRRDTPALSAGTDPQPAASAGEEAAFVRVADLSELEEGKVLGVTLDDQPLVLARVAGQVYALGGICPHRQGRLANGWLEGEAVVCPLHRSVFELRTGRVVRGPAAEPVPSFEVRVEGSGVLVRRHPAATG